MLSMKNINKIAIIRLSALGDIINSAVVLQFIKQHNQNIHVEWICEEVFSPLLQNHPLVNKTHTVNLKQLKKQKSFSLLKQTISYLKSLGTFDKVIDMQGLLKSAIVARLVGKNTHGFDKHSSREGVSSFFYKTTSNIPYDENIVKRNCFVVADALGFKITDEMLLNKEKIFPNKLYKFNSEKKQIAIVIGASWESKKYPKQKIINVCNKLNANIHIIWGDENEKKDAEFIVSNTTNTTLAPKLSLTELVDFISSVDLVIGNDTGPTHIAWAQNISSITLFGPTTSRMIYETPKNIAIKSSSHVDIFNINKNDFSIKDIDEDEIINKAQGLLK